MAGVDGLIVGAGVIAIAFAWYLFTLVAAVQVNKTELTESSKINSCMNEKQTDSMEVIYEAIREGADAFLMAEYKICLIFVVCFAAVIFFLIGLGQDFEAAILTTIAFVTGAFTSMFSGWIGMKVAVFANARTTIEAAAGTNEEEKYMGAFNMAFRAGGVMGFSLCGLGLLVLWFLLQIYSGYLDLTDLSEYEVMMDCISGYGLGGSTIAMFGRVGGGIYTKAADVGADLVGKTELDIPEDDPRNAATIADNVGDNVGDVAGMSSDLFGSFAEATCAALVISASSSDFVTEGGWSALMFPLCISASGILVCLVSSFLAMNAVKSQPQVEKTLKGQLIVTTVLMVPVGAILAMSLLPAEFTLHGVAQASFTATPMKVVVCLSSGVIGGLVIGLITEYYTSFSYSPVVEVANSCKKGGAATNIIYGLALGYKSAIIPIMVLAVIIFLSFSLCDTYGVAVAALGMLSTLATCLSIDIYGPVCDNAGGIAEMTLPELPENVRECTDALDAAGNTTAAIGKGFAIGSAALVSLALYGALVVRLEITTGVNVLEPMTFSFLLIGAMLPYWFSAMTMKSVGEAAGAMVEEVRAQVKDETIVTAGSDRLTGLGKETMKPGETVKAGVGILQGLVKPDYKQCIDISTKASLKEMVPPSALVIMAPLLAGTFFGVYAVFGILTGGLVSGVQLAISMSNTGGAWDNAKKYIEGKHSPDPDLQGKGTDYHKAAVVGDTVGDPLKDTSGPALNILMKLMAILSLVFAEYFKAINEGRGLLNIPVNV
mmetsp:Transcript_9172/g.22837  ORF Transcript_9172/g.22837 Transcript_9172/m.22837 type:complete len:773 (-) Transcript_9172:456-2774(-)|eukprot:CAMPEP_0119530326 /NCGR_PEP_ID=MMETSP1344-20130328/44164_1 /TAXON_ID=236787 /ORGANISM="Florenciella parvula, Strain CCMP2471" /LENGTH=772 /DNA_ID=CAMNT_0007570219 /DNA_START=48 /DNA_END=2366 /DNA_ORIENTATION=-